MSRQSFSRSIEYDKFWLAVKTAGPNDAAKKIRQWREGQGQAPAPFPGEERPVTRVRFPEKGVSPAPHPETGEGWETAPLNRSDLLDDSAFSFTGVPTATDSDIFGPYGPGELDPSKTPPTSALPRQASTDNPAIKNDIVDDDTTSDGENRDPVEDMNLEMGGKDNYKEGPGTKI